MLSELSNNERPEEDIPMSVDYPEDIPSPKIVENLIEKVVKKVAEKVDEQVKQRQPSSTRNQNKVKQKKRRCNSSLSKNKNKKKQRSNESSSATSNSSDSSSDFIVNDEMDSTTSYTDCEMNSSDSDNTTKSLELRKRNSSAEAKMAKDAENFLIIKNAHGDLYTSEEPFDENRFKKMYNIREVTVCLQSLDIKELLAKRAALFQTKVRPQIAKKMTNVIERQKSDENIKKRNNASQNGEHLEPKNKLSSIVTSQKTTPPVLVLNKPPITSSNKTAPESNTLKNILPKLQIPLGTAQKQKPTAQNIPSLVTTTTPITPNIPPANVASNKPTTTSTNKPSSTSLQSQNKTANPTKIVPAHAIAQKSANSSSAHKKTPSQSQNTKKIPMQKISQILSNANASSIHLQSQQSASAAKKTQKIRPNNPIPTENTAAQVSKNTNFSETMSKNSKTLVSNGPNKPLFNQKEKNTSTENKSPRENTNIYDYSADSPELPDFDI
jgi:hypothetical protein